VHASWVDTGADVGKVKRGAQEGFAHNITPVRREVIGNVTLFEPDRLVALALVDEGGGQNTSDTQILAFPVEFFTAFTDLSSQNRIPAKDIGQLHDHRIARSIALLP